MIPKIIHYCWFGEKPLPELALKCIESWKKYCPDYQIIQWNERNYCLNEKNEYVKEAYKLKKWAFVTDYVRFDVIYRYGGIYFDTDVELVKPIDDLLQKGAFMGMESVPEIINNKVKFMQAASGLGIASEPNNYIYKEILDGYEKRHFDKDKGGDDNFTVVTYVSDILMKHNPTILAENIIMVGNIIIYPPDYFCPLNYQTGELLITSNTRSIHHYMASWFTEKEREWLRFEQKIKMKFGEKYGEYICNSLVVRIIRLFYRRGIVGATKRIIKK